MSNLLRNVRFSFRMLLRNPGITLTVLLTLALGVGANTAIFTVDYATMLQPLPYPEPDRLMMVWSKIQTYHNVTSAGDFTDWKRENSSFQELSAWSGNDFNMATAEQPDKIEGRMVTPGFYHMLGIPMFLGRDFLPAEGQPGSDHEVILAHKIWKRLGSNMHVIGTTVKLNDAPYTVVGVLPPGMYDRQEDIAVPLAFTPGQMNHDFHWLLAMGRLKPGVTQQQAQADMDRVTTHIAQVYPKSDKGWGSFVEPLRNDFIPKEEIRTLWMLLGAVAFVLLIACVNVANLLLARSMARQKEMAVRSSLGASAGTIFAQLLTESLMLAIAGGALGVGVGYAMLRGLIAVMPQNTLPTEADLSLNIPILLFTLAATTLAGLLFGCIPAWYASRVDPAESLKEGGRAGAGVGRNRLRRVLVIGEFALALALLAGAGLAIHSFWNLSREDLGVQIDHVLTFFLPVPDSRTEGPGEDYGILPADAGGDRGGSRGEVSFGADGIAAVWNGLWDAVHDCGRADVFRSVAAAGGGVRDGDSGFFQDVWCAAREGAHSYRSGHGGRREGSGGKRRVCKEIFEWQGPVDAEGDSRAAHPRRTDAGVPG